MRELEDEATMQQRYRGLHRQVLPPPLPGSCDAIARRGAGPPGQLGEGPASSNSVSSGPGTENVQALASNPGYAVGAVPGLGAHHLSALRRVISQEEERRYSSAPPPEKLPEHCNPPNFWRATSSSTSSRDIELPSGSSVVVAGYAEKEDVDLEEDAACRRLLANRTPARVFQNKDQGRPAEVAEKIYSEGPAVAAPAAAPAVVPAMAPPDAPAEVSEEAPAEAPAETAAAPSWEPGAWRTSPVKSLGHFVITPGHRADTLLEVAKLGPSDLVLDLGCGDAGFLACLMRRSGCRGYGVEIDPIYFARAEALSMTPELSGRLRVELRAAEDLRFEDLREVTLVYIFLLHVAKNSTVKALLRQLLNYGTKIVTSMFMLPKEDFGDVPVISWPDDSSDDYWPIYTGDCPHYFFVYQIPLASRPVMSSFCAVEVEEHDPVAVGRMSRQVFQHEQSSPGCLPALSPPQATTTPQAHEKTHVQKTSPKLAQGAPESSPAESVAACFGPSFQTPCRVSEIINATAIPEPGACALEAAPAELSATYHGSFKPSSGPLNDLVKTTPKCAELALETSPPGSVLACWGVKDTPKLHPGAKATASPAPPLQAGFSCFPSPAVSPRVQEPALPLPVIPSMPVMIGVDPVLSSGHKQSSDTKQVGHTEFELKLLAGLQSLAAAQEQFTNTSSPSSGLFSESLKATPPRPSQGVPKSSPGSRLLFAERLGHEALSPIARRQIFGDVPVPVTPPSGRLEDRDLVSSYGAVRSKKQFRREEQSPVCERHVAADAPAPVTPCAGRVEGQHMMSSLDVVQIPNLVGQEEQSTVRESQVAVDVPVPVTPPSGKMEDRKAVPSPRVLQSPKQAGQTEQMTPALGRIQDHEVPSSGPEQSRPQAGQEGNPQIGEQHLVAQLLAPVTPALSGTKGPNPEPPPGRKQSHGPQQAGQGQQSSSTMPQEASHKLRNLVQDCLSKVEDAYSRLRAHDDAGQHDEPAPVQEPCRPARRQRAGESRLWLPPGAAASAARKTSSDPMPPGPSRRGVPETTSRRSAVLSAPSSRLWLPSGCAEHRMVRSSRTATLPGAVAA